MAKKLFYTGKGDQGYSHIGKKKIYKLNPDVHALGELDELNSLIGVLKSSRIGTELKKILAEVQESLFIIQANIAYVMLKESRPAPLFSPFKTKKIEKIIDDCERFVKPAKGFIIPGTTPISAWLDLLRARSRHIERAVLTIARDKRGQSRLNPDILGYLNRLSSLFFALARHQAKRAGKKEQHPTYR